MTPAVRTIYFRAAVAAGLRGLLRTRRARSGSLLVLNLHSVSPRENPYRRSLHPDVFDALLGFLVESCTVVGLDDLPRAASSGPRRPLVVLSFDDGLLDFVEYAMPLMERHRVRANLNVIGRSVETGEPPWVLELSNWLASAPAHAVDELLSLTGASARNGYRGAGKEGDGAAISRVLKFMPPADRARIWPSVRHLMEGSPSPAPIRMMRIEDVTAAHAAGHCIGSHSYSHESMELVDDDAFIADAARADRILRDAGIASAVYAFPNGSHRESQVAWLRANGTRHVLLTGERPSSPASEVHTRLTVRGSSLAEVSLRALGHDPVGLLRTATRRGEISRERGPRPA